jgi:hypothetical protein
MGGIFFESNCCRRSNLVHPTNLIARIIVNFIEPSLANTFTEAWNRMRTSAVAH